MRFTVLAVGEWPASGAPSRAFLVTDNWDDFRFNTLYSLYYVDAAGERHEIGGVKIAKFGMGDGHGRAKLPTSFERLEETFFSLGQDDSYYENLNDLGSTVRDAILLGLRDLALDATLFERARHEGVTGVSLLRSVSTATVAGQFHRLARGGARLSRYSFSYSPPAQRGGRADALTFAVEPESHPPTNIHVVIGRNGVGKT